MSAPDDDESLVDAICESYGIEDDDTFYVRALLERDPRTWPGCCGEGCNPCMANITSAAREILQRREG
ncbi:MAG: hypothetical protein AAF411_29230 [Myxococcota bacterium]